MPKFPVLTLLIVCTFFQLVVFQAHAQFGSLRSGPESKEEKRERMVEERKLRLQKISELKEVAEKERAELKQLVGERKWKAASGSYEVEGKFVKVNVATGSVTLFVKGRGYINTKVSALSDDDKANLNRIIELETVVAAAIDRVWQDLENEYRLATGNRLMLKNKLLVALKELSIHLEQHKKDDHIKAERTRKEMAEYYASEEGKKDLTERRREGSKTADELKLKGREYLGGVAVMKYCEFVAIGTHYTFTNSDSMHLWVKDYKGKSFYGVVVSKTKHLDLVLSLTKGEKLDFRGHVIELPDGYGIQVSTITKCLPQDIQSLAAADAARMKSDIKTDYTIKELESVGTRLGSQEPANWAKVSKLEQIAEKERAELKQLVGVRIWKAASGSYEVEAKFVKVNFATGSVALRVKGGDEINPKVSALSDDDKANLNRIIELRSLRCKTSDRDLVDVSLMIDSDKKEASRSIDMVLFEMANSVAALQTYIPSGRAIELNDGVPLVTAKDLAESHVWLARPLFKLMKCSFGEVDNAIVGKLVFHPLPAGSEDDGIGAMMGQDLPRKVDPNTIVFSVNDSVGDRIQYLAIVPSRDYSFRPSLDVKADQLATLIASLKGRENLNIRGEVCLWSIDGKYFYGMRVQEINVVD
jgi:hypothetical protein